MPVYATPDDLTDPPENALSQLRLASALVDDATLTAFYRTDADGMPIDEDIRELFKAATIAQVEYWAVLDVNPAHGAAGITEEARASTKQIGSASISYEFRFAQQNLRDRLASLNTLGPEALAILGHLAHGRVIVRG